MVETVTFSIFHRAPRGQDPAPPAIMPPGPQPPVPATPNQAVEARRRAAEAILGRVPTPRHAPAALEPSAPLPDTERHAPDWPVPPPAPLAPPATTAAAAPTAWASEPTPPPETAPAEEPAPHANDLATRDPDIHLHETHPAAEVWTNGGSPQEEPDEEPAAPHWIDAQAEPPPPDHFDTQLPIAAAEAAEPEYQPGPEPEPAAPWIEHATAAEPVPTHPAAHDRPTPPRMQDLYGGFSLEVEAQLLGLANPTVCTVIGTVGDAPPVLLSLGRTGIYRPIDFRPAPWSGFAYETPQDRRSGLMAGTRVLTARGEYPVEDLMPGDSVLTLRGPALLPIIWIGRSVAAEPIICIEAGALGPGRPRNQLLVGGEQAVFIDAKPISAHDLVNGRDIRISELGSAEMFHIDVGSAEVILAEAVPLASARR